MLTGKLYLLTAGILLAATLNVNIASAVKETLSLYFGPGDAIDTHQLPATCCQTIHAPADDA
ncbi:hypothetical protein [Pseudomonas sp. HY7a-MNA-CIBAN-0227]|uniref:hypothetical protein n=1 Tax=Pseudomonas sp. HY7a-MNA-CIBAN-0227 TaxID=3140474 RepID=UPI00332F46D9